MIKLYEKRHRNQIKEESNLYKTGLSNELPIIEASEKKSKNVIKANLLIVYIDKSSIIHIDI
jgi:hypothetical protein